MKSVLSWLKSSTKKAKESEASSFLLDYAWLESIVESSGSVYRVADPYPHIVLKNFLPTPVIVELLKTYPFTKKEAGWVEGNHTQPDSGEYVQKYKRHLSDQMAMPEIYRQLIWELHSAYFLSWLTKLTGIKHLIPDPGLFGAGIHEISRGGLLKVHSDFSTHRQFRLDRRLNLLIYLNDNWSEDWGGALELWDRELVGPPVKVLPVANTCVIFSTTGTSWHGHPHPLECPEHVTRKSLALYYYTNGRPQGEAEPGFATHWRDVPKV